MRESEAGIVVLGADLLTDLDVGPQSVPVVIAPLIVSFTLRVPGASLPAVEVCRDSSAPGLIFRPLPTLKWRGQTAPRWRCSALLACRGRAGDRFLVAPRQRPDGAQGAAGCAV
jgi:hypothetical protein